MLKRYLITMVLLYTHLSATQNMKCFDEKDLTNSSMHCYENQNNDVQNKHGKKGFLNPYTTEVRFNQIENNN